MNKRLALGMIASIVLALPLHSAGAADKPFPTIVSVPAGFWPEGFAIGAGTAAYSSSQPTGAIYKSDLRTGKGSMLVPPQPNPNNDVMALGIRVDPRTNYLFVAGGTTGKAFVYDTDSGATVGVYQLSPSDGSSLLNDLTITHDAVYFTDSLRGYFYRLSLHPNGQPSGDAAEVPLGGDFVNIDGICCNSNGIVATQAGNLIIANSNFGTLYRVDPASGHADAMTLDPPPVGFLDAMMLIGQAVYIVTPAFPAPVDGVQVVALDKGLLTGRLVGTITGPGLDQPASGARFGDSFYVVNSRWYENPTPSTEYWITKLDIHAIQP